MNIVQEVQFLCRISYLVEKHAQSLSTFLAGHSLLPFCPVDGVQCAALSRSIVSDSSGCMDCSPPGFSILGTVQEKTLEWVAIPFSRQGWNLGLLHCRRILYRTSTFGEIKDFNQLYLSGSNCDTLVDMRPEFSSVCKCSKNITSCQLAHTGIEPTTLALLAPHSNQLRQPAT